VGILRGVAQPSKRTGEAVEKKAAPTTSCNEQTEIFMTVEEFSQRENKEIAKIIDEHERLEKIGPVNGIEQQVRNENRSYGSKPCPVPAKK
jgi:cytidine deaminase